MAERMPNKSRFETFLENILLHIKFNSVLRTGVNNLFKTEQTESITIKRFWQIFEKNGFEQVDLLSPFETQLKLLQETQQANLLAYDRSPHKENYDPIVLKRPCNHPLQKQQLQPQLKKFSCLQEHLDYLENESLDQSSVSKDNWSVNDSKESQSQQSETELHIHEKREDSMQNPELKMPQSRRRTRHKSVSIKPEVKKKRLAKVFYMTPIPRTSKGQFASHVQLGSKISDQKLLKATCKSTHVNPSVDHLKFSEDSASEFRVSCSKYAPKKGLPLFLQFPVSRANKYNEPHELMMKDDQS